MYQRSTCGNDAKLTEVSASQPTTSSNILERCPLCSDARYFKGKRGLKVHLGKVHKNLNVLCSPFDNVLDTTHTSSSSVSNEIPFWQYLGRLKNSIPVLKRVPRGARPSVAQNLANCIGLVLRENSISAWEQLLTFPYRILHVQKDSASQKSLTSKIKSNCNLKNNYLEPKYIACNNKSVYQYVESKLREGDIRGASRLLFSSDVVAPCSPDTLADLQSKHPAPQDDLSFPDTPDPNQVCLQVTVKDVFTAVISFKSGSAGGLDGLTPQHLKDLLCSSAGAAGSTLLKELTALINFMLSGSVTDDIIDILYGANLCALRKKDGGIRPIAVGCTYRRLAAKICCKYYSAPLKEKFKPVQLGFGSKGGCEAAIRAVSTYLCCSKGEVILKVDLKNAFNSVNRDTLLTQAKLEAPKIFKFLWQCYRQPSKLIYKDNHFQSAVGCQQGDPLGPVIFSLAVHPIIKDLKSKLNVWYLDDGTLGGDLDTVLNDLEQIKTKFKCIGLELNSNKCEIFLNDIIDKPLALSKFNILAPGIKIVEKDSLRLLGSPIMEEGFSSFIDEKIQNFSEFSDRLSKINIHSAFTILRYCLFVPKLTHALRSSQFWKHTPLLVKMDNMIRYTLSQILNLKMNDRAWIQASLPIRLGGLGIRKISSVALPAFLSSVHSTEELTREILAPTLVNSEVLCKTDAINAWKMACPNTDLPTSPFSQKQWDRPLCKIVREELINTSINIAERARLLAVGEWESGLWLQALPSPNIGIVPLDNITFRIAAALRLGIQCISPHHCHCGEVVDSLGHHGLSCSRSAGRISRHANLNDIIRRSLTTAGVPAHLEPIGLARDDGKRPDGLSLLPWKMGRPLVWDATCVDTLAPSHVSSTASCAGAAAATAETLKRRKYTSLQDNYVFEPFGVETLGSWGPSAQSLYKEISKRLIDSCRDQKAGLHFAEKISIAIQRGNAASILGTLPFDGDVEEYIDIIL